VVAVIEVTQVAEKVLSSLPNSKAAPHWFRREDESQMSSNITWNNPLGELEERSRWLLRLSHRTRSYRLS